MAIRTIPSLVIGLGGTGKRALTHLKRRIYDTYGREDLPWVRLLSIDTDDGGVSNPPVLSQNDGKLIELGLNEMRVIDQSDTPKIISNLDAPENRHIKEWYPDPGQNVDFPKAAKGSGQVRMFGRVGLYKGENLYTTYRWLQQAAQDVSDPAAWDDFKGFNIDPGTQFVYIICSLAGGTGSGMFLDVAYLLRKIVGVDPSTRRFVGMFVMPEVYEPVVENAHLKRIYANSYAALRELDYLMNSQRRSYTIKGKDHTFVDFQRDVTPFDFVFLMSNKNKRGATISQRQVNADKPAAADDRVAQYVSETIMTDILSPVTERNESLLSNIFTSLGDPEPLDGRILYKSYSSVGVSSVKVPPLSEFQELLELKITDVVVDYLLRPDPDVTEKALAKQFFADNLAKVEDSLVVRQSLNNDASYARFRSKPFREEMKANRPSAINIIKQWFDSATKFDVDRENPLDIEKPVVGFYKDSLKRFGDSLNSTIRNYANDPHHGYTFITEWLDELLALCNAKQAQVPPTKKFDGDPAKACKEAFESLQRQKGDFQLPIMGDTMTVMLERVAEFYDNVACAERANNLMRSFYEDLNAIIQHARERLVHASGSMREIGSKVQEKLNEKIATTEDVSAERILIDKPMIGRKEIERFVNFLLSPIWAANDWKATVPCLSDEIQARVVGEISYRLLEICGDQALDDNARLTKLRNTLQSFVKERIFDQLFPIDSATGRIKEPNYADADGRSIIFDFGPENLLQLMLAHSSPLWFVQTHQVASATSPITFIGLNGTKTPDGLVEQIQKEVPTFRPTDVVLSDVEARIVLKQYDPLYSLASLANILDYENFYKNTDRKQNPMHTDLRFASEPNPYLQWLSYATPVTEELKTCARGHDVTRALAEFRQYCPDCFRDGIKSFIVPGKMMCSKCNKVIEAGSRKCPECLSLLDEKKTQCAGCIAQGRQHPETVKLTGTERQPVNCPQCGALWSDNCPYCNAKLERATVCTKGSDRCIFETPPITLCAACNCPLTPDSPRCLRCFREVRECQECVKRGEPKRMISRELKECPVCNSKKDLVAVSS
jgi:hypothetical protein